MDRVYIVQFLSNGCGEMVQQNQFCPLSGWNCSACVQSGGWGVKAEWMGSGL